MIVGVCEDNPIQVNIQIILGVMKWQSIIMHHLLLNQTEWGMFSTNMEEE